MTTFGISELARRSGFSPSTLRWYESIGVLPEPARSPAGYRQYGSDAVERLAFVAAGKQLGLRLDEIAELADMRTQRSCVEVREALARRITDRLATGGCPESC